MNSTIKLALWAIVGLVALYVVYQVVTIFLAFLGWLIQMAIMLGIAALVLFVGYFVLSNVIGGSGGATTSTERERIFE